MVDLKTKSSLVGLVINAKENSNPQEELERCQRLLVSNYKTFVATIIHDKDILENGLEKTIHLHAYIELDKKYTLKAVLSEISTLLDISLNLISIEATSNDYLLVQYLTHKNDKDKTQYPLDLVLTNDKEVFLDRWNKVYKSEEELRLEILDKCPKTDLLELVRVYGYNQINSMRGMIKDIKSESKSSVKELEDLVNLHKSKANDLEELVNNILVRLDTRLTKHEKGLLEFNDLIDRFEDILKYYNNR